jgi:hypothetical protein
MRGSVVAARKGDAELLATARIVGLYTLTALIAFTIIVDAVGRLMINPTYRTDSAIFLPLVAAWTGLMGLETAHLLRERRNGHNGTGE